MKFKGLLLSSVVVALAMLVFAFLADARLPTGAELPVHWNASGEPDRYAPALQALIISPLLLITVSLLFALIPSMEPLQQRLEASAPVLRISWIGIIMMMVLIEAVIGLPAFGITLPVNVIMLGIGIVLLMIGNALPKSRPGFFVGIRTPWTITDTDNWIATHRLGGKLMMLSALAIIVASILPIRPETTAIVVLTSVGVAAIIPIVYSWWFWRRNREST